VEKETRRIIRIPIRPGYVMQYKFLHETRKVYKKVLKEDGTIYNPEYEFALEESEIMSFLQRGPAELKSWLLAMGFNHEEFIAKVNPEESRTRSIKKRSAAS
jgi:hypothetical protein